MIEHDLILKFRDAVNESDWCYFKYKNNENKNQWNCICSAMDWIEVSVNYIFNHPLTSIRGNQSIELYSYLACVDIIVEAIEQLHRVLFSTNNQVFAKDTDCFINNPFHQNDREFFKSIRACFGAHPVNLSDPEEPDNKQAKRFASWSGGDFCEGDFSVVLYSNKVDGNSIILNIHYNQIEKYLEKYYSHLQALQAKIPNQYAQFCKQKAKEAFECSGTPLEQLNVLKEENKKRLDNDYYNFTLDDLIKIFSTPITCPENVPMVNRYLDYLQGVIDEIHGNLQKMEIVDLAKDTSMCVFPYDLPEGWHYWYEKLSDSVWGVGYSYLYWKQGIEKSFSGKFKFDYKSIDELYVLVKASLYQLECEQSRG